MSETDARPSGRRRLAGRLADAVVSPIMGAVDVESVVQRVDIQALVEQVDVNELVERVDIQALVEQIDINELVQRVDIQALVEQIDVNELVQRVDVNAVIEGVDMNSLMARTEIGAIVARSTTGMFAQLVDIARGIVIVIDLLIHRVIGRIIRPRGESRPGVPGDLDRVVDVSVMERSDTAVALQGHFAGPLSRLFGFITDQFVVGALFTAAQFLFGLAVAVVAGLTWSPAQHRLLTAVAYALWAFTYTVMSLAALGRTPGMAIVGLLVVRVDGSRLGLREAFVRTVALPLSFLVFGLGLLLGLFRRDRRQLHDLFAGTAVVYMWDAGLARLREPQV